MKTRRSLVTAMLLSGLVMLAGDNASAQESSPVPTAFPPANCLPGTAAAYNKHKAVYDAMINTLNPKATILRNQLASVSNPATYNTLLSTCKTIANGIQNGRVVITLPDGTVVVDTSKNNNTYQNFQNKAINENHNSRVAIFTAQQWACGTGIESKLSTSTRVRETYYALRLGSHLDSVGTARLSVQ